MRTQVWRQWAERHLDAGLACAILLWGGVATIRLHPRTGPLAANLLIVILLAAVTRWRASRPLVYTAATLGLGLLSTIWLDNITRSTWSSFVLLVPPFTVAAHLEIRRPLLGLAITLCGATAVDALQRHVLTTMLFTTVLTVASWSAGRATHHRRILRIALEERAARVAAEREHRERLAVAGERSRIARELHTIVANSVSTMVVQAEAAQRLLDEDMGEAELAMEEIESTGREALAEMRRILGGLRREDEGPELAPQPGVDQIHALIERARSSGGAVGLKVEGEPAPLPVPLDLAIYRIAEEALRDAVGAGEVIVRFEADEVELEVSRALGGGEPWPTAAMSERVSLCGGALLVEPELGRRERLVVRLPQEREEALA